MKLLRPLSNGKITGSENYTLRDGYFGGVLISTDGANLVTVTVTDAPGSKIFELITPTPGFVIAPLMTPTNYVTCAVSGANGYAQFYEWVNA